MHDQRKVKIDLDEKAKEEQREKVATFRSLYDSCNAMRLEGRVDRDVLTQLNVLLEQNPEAYTFFGYKRQIYTSLWEKEEDSASKDALKAQDLEEELQRNTQMITQDFKIYAAFVHRRWILNELAPARRFQVFAEERKKCEYLLKKDERNFHAWGYRRWVTQQLVEAGLLPADDDVFTETKINANFSNYSAWHNRAQDIERFLATSSLSEERFDKELQMCVNAIYCDPNDQSAWLFAEFLVRNALQAEGETARVVQLTEKLIASCQELLADDQTLSFPRWLLLSIWKAVRDQKKDAASSSSCKDASLAALDAFGGVEKVCVDLQQADPARAACYRECFAL